MTSLIINVALFSTSLQGCAFQFVLDNKSKPVDLSLCWDPFKQFSSWWRFSRYMAGILPTRNKTQNNQSINLLTFVTYFLTLWKISEMHHKTEKEVRGQTDESRQRSVRQRKRMLKFMKVVTFILQTLLIPVIPEVVASFRRLSSPNRVTDSQSGLFLQFKFCC